MGRWRVREVKSFRIMCQTKRNSLFVAADFERWPIYNSEATIFHKISIINHVDSQIGYDKKYTFCNNFSNPIF